MEVLKPLDVLSKIMPPTKLDEPIDSDLAREIPLVMRLATEEGMGARGIIIGFIHLYKELSLYHKDYGKFVTELTEQDVENSVAAASSEDYGELLQHLIPSIEEVGEDDRGTGIAQAFLSVAYKMLLSSMEEPEEEEVETAVEAIRAFSPFPSLEVAYEEAKETTKTPLKTLGNKSTPSWLISLVQNHNEIVLRRGSKPDTISVEGVLNASTGFDTVRGLLDQLSAINNVYPDSFELSSNTGRITFKVDILVD